MRILLTFFVMTLAFASAQTWEYAQMAYFFYPATEDRAASVSLQLDLPDAAYLEQGSSQAVQEAFTALFDLQESDSNYVFVLINHLGSLGWELVHMVQNETEERFRVNYTFKRQRDTQD